jgi:hypothetical protein
MKMEMKLASKYNILAVLLVLLALFANCTSALAADYEKVGVKVGNIADYETSLTSSDYNRTHILIYGIVGTVIYLNLTYYHPNGVVGSESQLVGDVFAGGGYLFAYLLAANLTAGDPIYSNAPEKINETITMIVAGTSRTVNHLSVITSNEYFDAYWDKATGLMTKLNFWLIGWINMTIISTDAWSITPPPPVAPPLSVKLSGEFDYSSKESINVRLAALVKDASTLGPVSNAHVLIEIYYPNGTLWISGVMLEKILGTGIYEWESSNKIDKMKLKEGVYLVHVKAFLGIDPTASDMLLFHIDPPLGSEDPLPTTMPYYVASAIVVVAGTIVGIFLTRRHKRLQAETSHPLKLTHTK